ncbi:zinc finger, CCHC-type containing protein [Tanacetum coccineum]
MSPRGGSNELKFLTFGEMGKAPRDASVEHYIQPGSIAVTQAMANEISSANIGNLWILAFNQIQIGLGLLICVKDANQIFVEIWANNKDVQKALNIRERGKLTRTDHADLQRVSTRHIGEQRVQQARLQTLKSDFEMLHMKEDETIDTFTGKLTTLVNKAASLGHTIEDSVVVRKLLNAVPDKFLQIVASIEQYSDLDEMSVDEAIGRLKTFEERIKSKKKIPVDSQESLMFTRHEGQRKPFRERGRFNQSRGQEQDKNNYKREERASFEEDTRDKSQVTCYRCHKLGHYAYECPNKCKNQIRG